MKGSATKSKQTEFTDREMHDSGLPVKGELGEAKKEVWALVIGIVILGLMLAFAFLDYMPA